MKLNFVSTHVLNNSRRPQMEKAQRDMIVASHEAATGRLYDPGVVLGHKTGRFVFNEGQLNNIGRLMDTNNLLAQRMAAGQLAINSLVGGKEANGKGIEGVLTRFNTELVGYPAVSSSETLQRSAQGAIKSFYSALDTNFNGEYVFGGTNTQQAPMKPYEDAQKVMQQAFEDFFGFASDDVQVKDITAGQMAEFIDGPFSELFNENNWKEYFSNAEDDVPRNIISPAGEMVDSGISANEKGFREALKNLALVGEFGALGLSDEAQEMLVSRTRAGMDNTSTGSAVTQIISSASRLGAAESQVSKATDRMNLQETVLNGTRVELIGVDQADAVQRVMDMMNMLTMSYQLTMQLSRMSLVNYL